MGVRARNPKPARRPAERRARQAGAAGWRFEPLTPARWHDFTALFGPRGACAGCWCMWARLPAAEFRSLGAPGRRAAIRRRVNSGTVPGLLAYEGDRPVGWAAVGLRSEFRRLENSRILAPVDDREVWSVPCFFVSKDARGRGLVVALLEAAGRFAAGRGAHTLEGYPVDTRGRRGAASFLWTGPAQCFRDAGFREAARRSPTRPIMRREVRATRARSGRG